MKMVPDEEFLHSEENARLVSDFAAWILEQRKVAEDQKEIETLDKCYNRAMEILSEIHKDNL